MAITKDEYKAASRAIEAVETRYREYLTLVQDAGAYERGGNMSPFLQNRLRDSITSRITSRLDTLKANIDADVLAIQSTITGYTLPEVK